MGSALGAMGGWPSYWLEDLRGRGEKGVVAIGVSGPTARGVEPRESTLWPEDVVDEDAGVSTAFPALRCPLLIAERRRSPSGPGGITISESGWPTTEASMELRIPRVLLSFRRSRSVFSPLTACARTKPADEAEEGVESVWV